ncbi:hypothetical protein PHYBLDRAFT_164489 [Phycomyces blakesleeanus NRRL 1555(-)]|uniref:Uncharacterized protein n=1 Tax=Phycomyces blakesleeanus (strain ATCC 8743b / DSM 1359 / FGSC 10004 / NBRC 33097 / NRRL 1555) TaxID=763407 RepID=A0A167PAV8_PHYB8|nr:hypothetical protein PHYBLDRAFT_164489 [Phycomyces blakesleeanus NRRL 1555(-)]OAD77586.1 hypothetical protein PHYBLDRAFT_164489 [Phycomyces blakesleeanus NRRL 1555(-)]|eukprot:XP_018295626.1 hypothetical protein PHYBLDRAFT_164489 [Phycomyces blakesleeanus NRRL 1555(-)]
MRKPEETNISHIMTFGYSLDLTTYKNWIAVISFNLIIFFCSKYYKNKAVRRDVFVYILLRTGHNIVYESLLYPQVFVRYITGIDTLRVSIRFSWHKNIVSSQISEVMAFGKACLLQLARQSIEDHKSCNKELQYRLSISISLYYYLLLSIQRTIFYLKIFGIA